MQNANHNTMPIEGQFVWCLNSGLKADGGRGVFEEVQNLIEYPNEEEIKRLVLCAQVIKVTDEQFNSPRLADELVTEFKFDFCGCCNDDIPDGTPQKLWFTAEYMQYWYTVGVAVVADCGKWFVIDTEGYNYPRYIYVPLNWSVMYKEIANKIISDIRQREIEEATKIEAEH